MPYRCIADRAKLLYKPYQVPKLQKGNRAAYLYRDGDMIVTA
jgi:hypothetical protein